MVCSVKYKYTSVYETNNCEENEPSYTVGHGFPENTCVSNNMYQCTNDIIYYNMYMPDTSCKLLTFDIQYNLNSCDDREIISCDEEYIYESDHITITQYRDKNCISDIKNTFVFSSSDSCITQKTSVANNFNFKFDCDGLYLSNDTSCTSYNKIQIMENKCNIFIYNDDITYIKVNDIVCNLSQFINYSVFLIILICINTACG